MYAALGSSWIMGRGYVDLPCGLGHLAQKPASVESGPVLFQLVRLNIRRLKRIPVNASVGAVEQDGRARVATYGRYPVGFEPCGRFSDQRRSSRHLH